MVCLLRAIRSAGDRSFGFRRAGRAVGSAGGADRRRHHQVLPRQPELDPKAVIRRLDRLQMVLAAMLASLGVMTVFSARADWQRQVVWVIAGAAIYVAAAIFDYCRLRTVAPGLYGGLMLLLVTRPLVAHSALAARRWLAVASVPLHP